MRTQFRPTNDAARENPKPNKLKPERKPDVAKIAQNFEQILREAEAAEDARVARRPRDVIARKCTRHSHGCVCKDGHCHACHDGLCLDTAGTPPYV